MSSSCVSAPTGTGTARDSEGSRSAGGAAGKVDSHERSGLRIDDAAMPWADRRCAGHLRQQDDRRDHHDGFAATSGMVTESGAAFMGWRQ